MKNYSIFDIVGPNMIGPSSSHTAGAARLGRVGYKIASEEIVKVVFYLHGSFAQTYKGHGTDKALIGGILGFAPDDERIRDSFDIAKEKGLEFEFIPTDLGDEHPNTVKMIITTISGKTIEIVGASIGGGNIKITQMNGLKLEFTGAYPTLIVKQRDLPGAAAHITRCLSNRNVNIAFMSIYRQEKGNEAFTIIEADDDINEHIVEDILKNKDLIKDAFIIKGLE
ncbi:L-serine dehydratase [Alkalithermobacter thermoalcaliphilus JW-YL-7 = DSM 7308]|uniref:L-serine deaminase n=1 Tax=Alkalithermobacter thermoalcaliphilus JW-YL-7 = DSM 7308 TaxID=1121328 RepID=A0A150FR99_CLOPD|nr:L-serine dehydratase, iron-sulfur-dependent, beta subunit [[Clostridium] paradoxum JW-YL-7 = DSM 7308]SHL02480.1 L-serine dehydratase [[Clostridium] paradoxum JW-YL-7 = DSM 7308]